jgi:predicted DNA-binding ribbon-helix-helix protein
MLDLSTWVIVLAIAALLIFFPQSPCGMRFARQGGTNRGLVPMAHLRGEAVKSSVSKRSIVIAGHKTSVSLEGEFWNSLKEIAVERGMTLGALVAAIDGNRQHANLSSAIRLFVLGVYRDQRR